MKLEKEVRISEITRCPYYQPRLDDSFKITLDNDNLSENEYEKLCKISKSKKIKLTLEIPEPILDDAERKYLSGVIRPFRDRIKYIRKNRFSTGREFIWIQTKDDETMTIFPFEQNTMYKGMELDKEYSLKDLEL